MVRLAAIAVVLVLGFGLAHAAKALRGSSQTTTPVPTVTVRTLNTFSPASNTQAVATLSASNSPISWAIASCSACMGYFAIDNSGNITVTMIGASNLTTGTTGAIFGFNLVVNATNSSGTSANATIPIKVYADGMVNSQAGGAQFPNLLDRYGVGGIRNKTGGYQPAWNVAGVDYAVGVSMTVCGGSLADPAKMSIAGATVNNSTHQISVIGNGVTIQCFDFSLEGGLWQITVTGANCTIKNNNFAVGSTFPNTGQTSIINGGAASSGLRIEYNTIDGGGNPTDGASQGGGSWTNSGIYAALLYSTGGSFTVKYNYLKNSASQNVDYGGTGTFLHEYNLERNSALVGHTHNNWMQFTNNGAISTPQSLFNTGYQSSVGGNSGVGCGEAFQVDAQGGFSITGAEVGFNTGIAAIDPTANCPTLARTASISYLIAYHAISGSNLSGNIHDNYLDYRGAIGPFIFDAASGNMSIATCSNNINMNAGGPISGTYGAATCN